MSPDFLSRNERSEVMRKIRSKGTRLDLTMKGLLELSGIGFTEYPKIEGKPDFLVGENIVIFCDSSFWHGRNWRKLKQQLERGARADYLVDHIRRNRRRDKIVTQRLSHAGFTILRFWDTDVYTRPDWCASKIAEALCADGNRSA